MRWVPVRRKHAAAQAPRVCVNGAGVGVLKQKLQTTRVVSKASRRAVRVVPRRRCRRFTVFEIFIFASLREIICSSDGLLTGPFARVVSWHCRSAVCRARLSRNSRMEKGKTEMNDENHNNIAKEILKNV